LAFFGMLVGIAMSDQALGKKVVEEALARHFLEAYRHATGKVVAIAQQTERPDFLCRRGNGLPCGLELVQVRRDPRIAQGFQIAFQTPFMAARDAAESAYDLVMQKEKKRQQPDWKMRKDTILAVLLPECRLCDLEPFLESGLSEDLDNTGFSETWIVDYTTMEAFREVELYCVSPTAWRGQYGRAHPDRKPYG
jgi:hypothetical protein